jgi:hypothetical protein
METLLVLDYISQIAAVILGCWSLYLVNQRGKDHPNKKWAPVLGAISEPFWVFTLIFHGQWIAVLVKLFYTYSWITGINNYWIKPRKAKKPPQ